MDLIELELSFGNYNLNISPITRISSLKYVRFNIDKHCSNELIQQLQNLIIVRVNVKFEIFSYCTCDGSNLQEVDEHFKQFENVILLS